LQLDFRLFCSLSWSAFSALPAFILFFLFFIFGKKNEFWGITQNWVMTISVGNSVAFLRFSGSER
jgi:hypothetical protein